MDGVMFYLRLCPKCQGDMLPRTDTFGSYVTCIQCGHVLYPGVGGLLGALSSRGDDTPGERAHDEESDLLSEDSASHALA